MPTILIRRIEDTRAWRDVARDPAAALASLPIWTLREFTPRSRDENGLSVYEIEDDEAARKHLASALSMVWDEPHLFVGVSLSDFAKSGVTLKSSKGATFDSEVNSWHREIVVNTIDEVTAVTNLFISGTPHRYDKNVCFETMRVRAVAGGIDLMSAWAANDPPRTLVGRLIDKKSAKVVAV